MDSAREWTRNLPSSEELLRALAEHSRSGAETVRDWTRHLPPGNAWLRALGLQQRRSAASDIMPSLALFGAGVLVGAVLGLLFAPTSGEQLRSELGERAHELRDRAAGSTESEGPYQS